IEAAIELAKGAVVGALPAGPLRDLLVSGVIAGVGNVVVFVPQIALLSLFIVLLEDSGYLARVAFVIDRVMRGVGLHGRAFVPLLSGFACAVPAIMATRTIESRRDRLVTMLALPLMSCSARLPVYALLIGAFVPDVWVGPFTLPGITLFSMYLLGVLVAIGVAAVLKRTVLQGGRPLYVMELPSYRAPSWRTILPGVRDRSLLFVRKAGTVILATSICLWFLGSYPRHTPASAPVEARLAAAVAAQDSTRVVEAERDLAAVRLEHSWAGRVGRAIEPVIAPLGFDWRIGIGLITSLAAREVMVSTMATVFHLGGADEGSASLREQLRTTVDPRTGERAYSPLIGVSLMVFFVLACQCMSTVAVVRRETESWRWPLLMLVLMNSLAWLASFVVFQVGRALGLGT
ncbi:MAG: ferrous iron transporter B, partial [bacterium]